MPPLSGLGSLRSPLFPRLIAVGHMMAPAKAGFGVVPGPYFSACAPSPSPRKRGEVGASLLPLGSGLAILRPIQDDIQAVPKQILNLSHKYFQLDLRASWLDNECKFRQLPESHLEALAPNLRVAARAGQYLLLVDTPGR